MDSQGWISEARLRLEDALLLCRRKRHARSISACYYASHAATKGLLLHRHIEVRSHDAIISQLSLYYVRGGVLPSETASWLDRLYKDRLSADYECQGFTFAQATRAIRTTRSFIASAENVYHRA